MLFIFKMLEIWEQNVIKELVAKSDLQKHIFERNNQVIWDEILHNFNLITKKNLCIEDLRDEWTHIYETIGYTSLYSNITKENENIKTPDLQENALKHELLCKR